MRISFYVISKTPKGVTTIDNECIKQKATVISVTEGDVHSDCTWTNSKLAEYPKRFHVFAIADDDETVDNIKNELCWCVF